MPARSADPSPGRAARSLAGAALLTLLPFTGTIVAAQDPAPADPPAVADAQHDHMQMNMDMPLTGWQFMQDGVLFAVYNNQGGPRGGDEFIVPNWWMGMASRTAGPTELTLNAMISLDPATVGKSGYREIFQVGETLNGQPLIDRQHPHDLFMQLAAIWRAPVTDRTGLTVAGGPAGEPALGPVAFMHRPSAAEDPSAPLSHHTFDSTHISFGVITAAIDHGPFVVEGSVFNGREPDENRWDFDFGRMDSVSGRVWYRPNAQWELQVSTGHLTHPEALTPAAVVFYAVPDALKATHGAHPVSFQVFFRVRPPAGPMGRMWNMRMSQPKAGHAASHAMP